MMKRLFVAFLVVGALMSVEALGADNQIKNSGNPIESAQKETAFVADTYNQMISLAQEVTQNLISSSYKSISSIFNNVISVLLGLIAFFWLFKHLKTGTISREEAFKAIVWVITFVIVYVLLNSRGAFTEFASVLNIPQHLVNSALATEGGNVAQRLNNAFYKPYALLYHIAPQIIDYYWESASLLEKVGAILMGIFAGGAMTVVYAIFIIFNLILVVAIIIIQMYATFLGGIYLIFLPLTIPLLLIPQTKGIFFACIKSYIGITMYIPLSMLPISILNSATKIFTAQDYSFLIMKIPYYTLVGIISCIIGILLLYKMPTWISELLGVANQGVGAGGALGMMKTAGMGLGAYGKNAAQNIMNASTGKTALTRGLLNAATGGLSGAFGEGKTAIKKIAKGGFTALANHFKGKNNG